MRTNFEMTQNELSEENAKFRKALEDIMRVRVLEDSIYKTQHIARMALK